MTSQPVVGLYTIGQTPRPDLTRDIEARFPSTAFDLVGALDGLSSAATPAWTSSDEPLETLLRDGERVVVGADFVAPRLQRAIERRDRRVIAHLVLCASPFPGLESAKPLIRPFAVGVDALAAQGVASLDVVLPFADQSASSSDKWRAAGFSCDTHALDEKPVDASLSTWLKGRIRPGGADALVFDYVGLPAATVDQVAAALDLPVFDLGRVAMDVLATMLQEPGEPFV